jgi:hypothetical protein
MAEKRRFFAKNAVFAVFAGNTRSAEHRSARKYQKLAEQCSALRPGDGFLPRLPIWGSGRSRRCGPLSADKPNQNETKPKLKRKT